MPVTQLGDKRLPSLDGLEIARRIRAHERHQGSPPATLVLCTADAFRETEEQALAAGCDGYLTKPVDPLALETIVRRAATRGVATSAPRGGTG